MINKERVEMAKTKLEVKVILLDLDGTLVDSKEAYKEAVQTAFAALGQNFVSAEVATEIPKRLEQNLPINDLLRGGVDTKKFLDVYLNAYYKATVTKSKPMPKIEDTLEKLSKKAALALITMRYVPKENVIKELENFGLAKYFTHVITALDTHTPKPSPEALIKCARKFGVQPHECLVVGDSVADIKAGKNAGAKTVAVLSGIFSRKELEREKPDLILESVNQLPCFLE
ncbi:MAG: HAD family hydrolase [Candidatus Bathycorpusculaceae bacterium]